MKRWLTKAVVINVMAGLCLLTAANFVHSAKADLNGDGKMETIVLEVVPDSSDFVLKVNHSSIKGSFSNGGGEPEDTDLMIVDIDRTDPYQEIAVHNPGPSDDDEYLVYWYDGVTLKQMGDLARWPDFSGNGIVMVGNWMGFWTQKEKYVLDKKERMLKPVPQEFYYVGVESEVKATFPLYRTKNGPEVVANLKPQSKCLVLLFDASSSLPNEWYLIKSSTGIVGWARYDSIFDKLVLPLAD